MSIKIAVIGCGNMAQAIILGMAKSFKEIEFHTFTPSYTRAEDLAQKIDGKAWKELSEIPACDYYLIACKPQQVEELAQNFRNFLPSNTILISVLAGVTVNSLKEKFQCRRVARVMPNTPALVGEGVHAIYFSEETEDEKKAYIHKVFASIGEVFVFDEEEKIDVITGFSGSGPAYIFEIARIMTEKLSAMGVEEKMARQMIKSTLFGSAKLLKESDEDAETLRNNVTSKNGVTYEALEVFKKNNLEEIFGHALDAAFKRSKELAQAK